VHIKENKLEEWCSDFSRCSILHKKFRESVKEKSLKHNKIYTLLKNIEKDTNNSSFTLSS